MKRDAGQKCSRFLKKNCISTVENLEIKWNQQSKQISLLNILSVSRALNIILFQKKYQYYHISIYQLQGSLLRAFPQKIESVFFYMGLEDE